MIRPDRWRVTTWVSRFIDRCGPEFAAALVLFALVAFTTTVVITLGRWWP